MIIRNSSYKLCGVINWRSKRGEWERKRREEFTVKFECLTAELIHSSGQHPRSSGVWCSAVKVFRLVFLRIDLILRRCFGICLKVIVPKPLNIVFYIYLFVWIVFRFSCGSFPRRACLLGSRNIHLWRVPEVFTLTSFKKQQTRCRRWTTAR